MAGKEIGICFSGMDLRYHDEFSSVSRDFLLFELPVEVLKEFQENPNWLVI